MGRHLLRSIWARKRRLMGAGFAVVIGVAFLAATMVLGDSMRTGMNDLFSEGNSGTDVLVRNATEIDGVEMGARGTLPESLVADLATNPDVRSSLASVDGLAQVVGPDGPIGGDGPPTIGSNWLTHDRNPYVVVDGHAPESGDQVVLDTDTAALAEVEVGDQVTVLVPGARTFDVVGIAQLQSGESMGGVTFAWFDTDTAQAVLLGDADQVSGINLTAVDGISQDELAASIEPQLPATAEAITGVDLTTENNDDVAADFLDFFEVFLLVFAGIALLVATFSIHNTLSILVAQRTRESALLRAIGASRVQVLVSVAIEALVLGVVASAVGIGAGLGLAYGLDALLSAVGFGIPTAPMALDQATVIAGLAVGVGVTFLASLAPALKASRVPPIAALREVEVDQSHSSIARAVIGALITATGIAAVATAGSSESDAMLRAGLGSLLTLVGFVMVGPVVARKAASWIGAPIAMFGGRTGKLARRNAMRNPRRTAGTASALMIGTAVVALFATFAASLKASLDELLDQGFTGDLVVVQDGFSGAGLPPQLGAEIAELDSVGTATALAFANVTFDGVGEEPNVVEPAQLSAVVDLGVIQGSFDDVSDNGLMLSSRYAEEMNRPVGSTVEIGFDDGSTTTATIEVIYEDGNLLGDVLVPDAMWAPHEDRGDDFLVMIRVADGFTVEQARADIDAISTSLGAPAAQDRDEYLDTAAEDLDAMLTMVYGMLGLAILIALLGIANTLSLSLHERTRELGLLRAIGQTKRQLRRTVRWESVIIAVFGTVGGLGLGTFLGWGLMQAIEASEGLGAFVAPVGTLAVVLGVAVLAGVVAAIRPARRAAKLDVLAAIATN